MSSDQIINSVIAVSTLALLAWTLYRPRIQQSARYQAMVVPLANIMDVGFIAMSPIIIVLVGYDAPLFMLAICLTAIATGFAISYNIRAYEPRIGMPDRIHRIEAVARWSLFGASIANIAYYTQLLMTLVLLPLNWYTDGGVTLTSVAVLVIVTALGFAGYLPALNRLGDRTTAFNLAAVFAVIAAFLVFNAQEALAGRWELPSYNPPNEADDFRKLLGFFVLVQGFEASRYMGRRVSADLRISTMRLAQWIATGAFVLLVAGSLLLFVQLIPEPDATAIFVVSDAVSPFLPWLILLAAVGSQLSAITNATSSRSELLTEATHDAMPHKYTFPVLLIPAMILVLFTNVTSAVAVASRVFAFYFLLQASIAIVLAKRLGAWGKVFGFVLVGLVMAVIMVFGIPT